MTHPIFQPILDSMCRPTDSDKIRAFLSGIRVAVGQHTPVDYDSVDEHAEVAEKNAAEREGFNLLAKKYGVLEI